MESRRRLEFIAEGLPIIFGSAQSLIKSSQILTEFPREAEILRGHAEEECAKILILIDIIRCQPKVASSRIGPMIKSFYDHLARLIYSEAQSWKPVSVTQLQEYVNIERQSHYLEGQYSEYIMPNWTLFRRESAIYADVIGTEALEASWSSPLTLSPSCPTFDVFEPKSYCVADALEAFGLFSVDGLRILSDVWGKVDFDGDQNWSTSRTLYSELVERLYSAKLLTDRANEDHARTLEVNWQMPMYHIDFSPIPVSLDELIEMRGQDIPYY